MKITKLLLGLTAGVLAASCSTDDTASNSYTAQEDGMRYLKVALCNPTSTRASLSSPDGYENGSDDENRIEGLRFVFYDTKGNRVSNVVDFNKSDLQDMQTGSGTGSGGTVEKFNHGHASYPDHQGRGASGLCHVLRQPRARQPDHERQHIAQSTGAT